LIFILIDEPERTRDTEIADFVLEKGCDNAPIDPELFKKYIIYARNNITRVQLSEEAKRRLRDYYVNLREKGKNTGTFIITTRQLEGLKRLTIASAKVRLSNVATLEDAERAIKIFEESLRQIAIDPETGNLDIDIVITGVSASQRKALKSILEIIKELEDMTPWGATEEAILSRAEEIGLSRDQTLKLLEKLKKDGDIFCPRYGYYKVFESEGG
jgi:replicative DNA helicase Mcm